MSITTGEDGLPRHAAPAIDVEADADAVLAQVGSTRLVPLETLSRGLPGTVFVKLESENPGGSIKDRTALSMVRAAERSGDLQPGGTIVESTSGNTGIGLAFIGALTGHPVVVVTGDSISSEKLEALQRYGAQVVFTDWSAPSDSPANARAVAARITAETPGAWRPLQFDNPANPRAHYEGTAPEIWEQTAGRITHFVAGVGTGGTITGNGRFLKEKSSGHVEVIGADPYGSVYSGGHPGRILVDGVGNSWPKPDWPKVFDPGLLDRFLRIPDNEVYTIVHKLLNEEELSLGPSSGLTVAAALRVARAAPHGSVVVAIAPDTGLNYLSKAFNPDWLADNHIRLDLD